MSAVHQHHTICTRLERVADALHNLLWGQNVQHGQQIGRASGRAVERQAQGAPTLLGLHLWRIRRYLLELEQHRLLPASEPLVALVRLRMLPQGPLHFGDRAPEGRCRHTKLRGLGDDFLAGRAQRWPERRQVRPHALDRLRVEVVRGRGRACLAIAGASFGGRRRHRVAEEGPCASDHGVADALQVVAALQHHDDAAAGKRQQHPRERVVTRRSDLALAQGVARGGVEAGADDDEVWLKVCRDRQ
mmetsp:Transcript_135002/g.431307  ORF Transcript_135002/g.431307 Transcript_135002/m.431307 type:complete len:246 (+) Transcript_135002:930-1667(+)